MDNKNAFSKILILVIIAVLVIGGIFVWQEWLKSDLRLKIKDSRLPKGIEVIEQGDKKIVKNKAEGYEVTVPKELGRIEGIGGTPEKPERGITIYGAMPAEGVRPSVSIRIFPIPSEVLFDEWVQNTWAVEGGEPECYVLKEKRKIKDKESIIMQDQCSYGALTSYFLVKYNNKIYEFSGSSEDLIIKTIESFNFEL